MANKKHQRLPGLNILHNQSNGHSRNYSVRTVLTLICVGSALQSYGIPRENSGETDAPIFEEYRIPGTSRILKLERLWERDLSEFSGDADENNHNMFVDGGILYCYLEHYEGGTSRSIILRRFNAETGEMLPEIAVPYPVTPGNNTQLSVQGDGNGNLIIAGILPNANLGRGRLHLSAGTYSHDADGLHVVGQPIAYERTTGENDASYHYYRGAFEWLEMTEEATGSYQLTVGCWHHYGKFPDDRTPFYPGRLLFSCSPDWPEPKITYTRYAPQQAYGLNTRDNILTGGSAAEGMLFSQVLPNGLHLVQGFGKSASENTAHTPGGFAPGIYRSSGGAPVFAAGRPLFRSLSCHPGLRITACAAVSVLPDFRSAVHDSPVEPDYFLKPRGVMDFPGRKDISLDKQNLRFPAPESRGSRQRDGGETAEHGTLRCRHLRLYARLGPGRIPAVAARQHHLRYR